MIDLDLSNTFYTDHNTATPNFLKSIKPFPHNQSQGMLPSHQYGKKTQYLISHDLIRIIIQQDPNPNAQRKRELPPTELIFPRENLHSFSFSDTKTMLEYTRENGSHLKISVFLEKKLVRGVLYENGNKTSGSARTVTYTLKGKRSVAFTKFISQGWISTKKIALPASSDTLPPDLPKHPQTPVVKATKQAAAPTPPRSTTPSTALILPKIKTHALLPASPVLPPLKNSKTPTQDNDDKKKGSAQPHKLALFRPAKLLDKQLLRSSLDDLFADTKNQKIFDHYLRSKKKKILQKITPRIKPGTTLSLLYPDYQNYDLVKKISIYREQNIEPSRVQSGYYIWQEGSRIITASNTGLMPLRVAENILQKHMSLRTVPKPTRGAYLKKLDETYMTAMKKPYPLNKKGLARLRKLLRLARLELMKNDSNMALSPAAYGKSLTNLRSWITFDYLKRLPVKKFHRYFNRVEQMQGRGRYTHTKFTQILGLQDTGRIVANRDFLNQYHYAIEIAAKNYPKIPKKWIEQIIWIETKGDPRSISHAGAYGVMQLLPDVFLGKGEVLAKYHTLSFVTSINPFNAAQNIERGTAFLDSMLSFLDPVIRKYPLETKKQILFHAYNRGPTKVRQLVKEYGLGYVSHLPRETRLYLSRLGDFPS